MYAKRKYSEKNVRVIVKKCESFVKFNSEILRI